MNGSYSRFIDLTDLKPTATACDIEDLCEKAASGGYANVCVAPYFVSLAESCLRDFPDTGVCTVVGFPLGANKTEIKVFETREAIDDGATEIDMVINIGALRLGNHDRVSKDIEAVVRTCRRHDIIVKAIIGTDYLTEEEIKAAAETAAMAKVDFIKTCTGFGPGVATVEHIRAIKEATKGLGTQIKASGGIKTYDDVLRMISAGAIRIGTSSHNAARPPASVR